MLTDTFASRYRNTLLRDEFTQLDQAVMVQGFRLCFEQVFPFWIDGKESPSAKAALQQVHDRLTMELGLRELSSGYYAYQTTWNGKPHTVSGIRDLKSVCETWLCKPYDGSLPVSRFLAERVSFFELTFRTKEEQVSAANSALLQRIPEADLRSKRKPPVRIGTVTIPGSLSESYRLMNETLNRDFRNNVEELNSRFRQANYRLYYRNGFVQLTDDDLSTQHIEKPFWEITSEASWENVDIDMKEAIDRRDNGGCDPASMPRKRWRA